MAWDIIISDIDNTVIDPSERLSPSGEFIPKLWMKDKPIPEIINPIRTLMKRGYKVVFLTGRNIKEAPYTLLSLIKCGVILPDELGDKAFLIHHRLKGILHNAEYKIKFVRKMIERGLNPILWIEDTFFYEKPSADKLRNFTKSAGITFIEIKSKKDYANVSKRLESLLLNLT